MRGLKLADEDATLRFLVAPYVGAWIETNGSVQSVGTQPVAPYVGAWIETQPNW